MKRSSVGWGFLFGMVALLFVAGCAPTKFVYKPNVPAAGGPKLPVNVAVIPFKDGTEDFTSRGSSVLDGVTWNLAKSSEALRFPALPPALWAKSLADDMTTSGAFQTVRFIYSSSELVDEDFYIEGTLKKAYVYSTTPSRPNEFALGLRAMRRADSRQVWEKEVSRVWKTPTPSTLYEGCGMSVQCTVDRYHADMNRMMQSIFAEARADLVATLASLGKGRSGEDRKDKETSTPQDPDSVERTIDRILKGK